MGRSATDVSGELRRDLSDEGDAMKEQAGGGASPLVGGTHFA